MPAELTIVVPTYNESDNIERLVNDLTVALKGVNWELIIVDDNSPDGTSPLARSMAQKNAHVRCIQRLGRRGLSSACIEGFLASASPYIAVMDADGQHDEQLLKQMLQGLKNGDADLINGSRYITEGSTGQLPPIRVKISKAASAVAHRILNVTVSDPMSGFFMFKRTSLEPTFEKLSGQGFKILLDMLVTAADSIRVTELPYTMRARAYGESKLDSLVVLEFFSLIIDKLTGRQIPLRFFMFTAVGLTGVVVHMATLNFFFNTQQEAFWLSQTVATVVAMTTNFLLNNSLTFRDRRLRGKKLLSGLLSFYIACSLGAAINIEIAASLYEYNVPWAIAGISGAAIGAVWNYAMTTNFTWKKK